MNEDEEENKKKTKAENSIRDSNCTIFKKLFVDEYQEPHAAISVNNEHIETIPIRSRRFRNYLSNVVYNDCGDGCRQSNIERCNWFIERQG